LLPCSFFFFSSLTPPPPPSTLFPIRRSFHRRPPEGFNLLPALDLHVLGIPPAFVLSQDQTLHKMVCFMFSSPMKTLSFKIKVLTRFKHVECSTFVCLFLTFIVVFVQFSRSKYIILFCCLFLSQPLNYICYLSRCQVFLNNF